MRKTGCVVLDVNCFKYLESEATFGAVIRSLRAVDLELWPTAANCLEAATTQNPAIRARLLTVVRTLAKTTALLPDPHELLRLNARAALEGKAGFRCGASGLEWMLGPSATISDELLTKGRALLEEADSAMEDAHAKSRKLMQAFTRDANLRERWSSAGAFLDDQWMQVDQVDVFLDEAWERLELGSRPAPHAVLLANPAWRLYLEGIGISIYRGTISPKQGRRVQHSDLEQLIYLAGRERRILVSEDVAFVEAANQVLVGRHSLARATLWTEFLALTS